MSKKSFISFFCILWVALLSFSACGSKDEITIEGTLENGAGKIIYIEEMSPTDRIFIDSIKLDKKGHFKVNCQMPYRTFYNLHVSEADYVVLLPQQGEPVNITGNYDSLSNSYKVLSGYDSQLLWQLQDYSNTGARQLREIVATDQKNRELLNNGELSDAEFNREHAITDSIFLSIFSDQQRYVAHFIEDNLGSLATLIALYKPFNNMPLVDPKNSFEFYEGVLAGLEESMPDNPHTLNFKNTVERTRFTYAQ